MSKKRATPERTRKRENAKKSLGRRADWQQEKGAKLKG